MSDIDPEPLGGVDKGEGRQKVDQLGGEFHAKQKMFAVAVYYSMDVRVLALYYLSVIRLDLSCRASLHHDTLMNNPLEIKEGT